MPMSLDSPGPPEASVGYLWAALLGGQLSSTDIPFFRYLRCLEVSIRTEGPYHGLSSTPSRESDPATYCMDSMVFKNFRHEDHNESGPHRLTYLHT